MKVRFKLLIVLISFSVLIFAILLVNFYLSSQSTDIYVEDQLEKLNLSATNAIGINNELLFSTVTDYTYWDELCNFTKVPDTTFANEYLLSIVDYAHVDYEWVYDLNGNRKFYANKNILDSISEPISPTEMYAQLDTTRNSDKRYTSFCIRKADEILVVNGGTIHQIADTERKEKPFGAFFLAKIIDSTFTNRLGILTNSKVSLKHDSVGIDKSDKRKISCIKPIKDYNEKVVAWYFFEKNDSYIEKNEKSQRKVMLILLIFIVFSIVSLGLIVNKWLNVPFNELIRALDKNEVSGISKYLKSSNEFGKLSNLIAAFFKQKKALESEIEERTIVSLQLAERNMELKQHNEEIKALNGSISVANEELRQNNEEIITLNDDIIQKSAEIEIQNSSLRSREIELQLANKQIVESINYAAGLQRAVMPPNDVISKLPFENFVYFRPRDIVSGDFYFIYQKEDSILFAAADCTGHGVPGAFLSMLSISLLNEIVHRNRQASPAEYLCDLRRLIKISLSQTGKESLHKDGLDIAFCKLNIKTLELEYAGAYQPLWIFRESENPEAPEFIEIAANRQPIGIYHKEVPFDNHKIQLQKNDKVFVFSDGYTSQLGGKHVVKFKKDNFKNLLKSVRNLNSVDQTKILDQLLMDWTGTNQQTDDILVLGLKI